MPLDRRTAVAERVADVAPERRGLARTAGIVDGATDEHRLPARARERRVQLVAVGRAEVLAHERQPATGERAAHGVAEQRVGSRAAGQPARLEAEHDDHRDAVRAGAPQPHDAHAPRGPIVAEAHARRLERRHELGRGGGLGEPCERGRDLARCPPGIEPERGLRVRLDVGVEPEGGGGRALEDLAERSGRIVRLAQLVDGGERPRALLAQVGVDIGGLAPALPADAPVPVVDARAGQPDAGERSHANSSSRPPRSHA